MADDIAGPQVVGPGAFDDNVIEAGSVLDGVGPDQYVTLLNPMTVDFQILVGQTKPIDVPFKIRKDTTGRTSSITNTESDARQVYGLTLKNADHVGQGHIANRTIVRAGKTINLRGDEAQVALKQLVNEVIQRRGQRNMLADPKTRKDVEQEIIQAQGSIEDLMKNRLKPRQDQIQEALDESNKEVGDEQAFPEATGDQAESAGEANQGGGRAPEPAKDTDKSTEPKVRRATKTTTV